MAKGKKTGGRKAGTPNKMTAAAKEVISGAAAALGGQDRLVAWAQEDALNERAFWTAIFTKLLPHEVSGPEGGPIEVKEIRNLYVAAVPALNAPTR